MIPSEEGTISEEGVWVADLTTLGRRPEIITVVDG
jgi:hypothetical protein